MAISVTTPGLPLILVMKFTERIGFHKPAARGMYRIVDRTGVYGADVRDGVAATLYLLHAISVRVNFCTSRQLLFSSLPSCSFEHDL